MRTMFFIFIAIIISQIQTQLQTVEKFHILEGGQSNFFIREGNTVAHLLVKPSRVIVAFPEENSGIGIWTAGTQLEVVKESLHIYQKGKLRGIRFTIRAKTKQVLFQKILLNNIRILRDYTHHKKCPQDSEVRLFIKNVSSLTSVEKKQIEQKISLKAAFEWLQPQVNLQEKKLEWTRSTLDGKNRYFLGIYPQDAKEVSPKKISTNSKEMLLNIVTALDFPPYHPITQKEILAPQKQKIMQQISKKNPKLFHNLQNMLRNLSFLSYKEKVMAGSWRFLTYFGRDSIMSLRMLRPIVRPQFYKNILYAVLARIDQTGEVAHEEDIGDQAMVRRLIEFNRLYKEKGFSAALAALENFSAPIHDYKMIDDNFMLPIMVAEYLEGSDKKQTSTFFAKNIRNKTVLARVLQNANFVLREFGTGKFIPLRDGELVGDWRDSQIGLAFEKYAFSVSGALVPVALFAIKKILAQVPTAVASKIAQKNKLFALLEVLKTPQKLEQKFLMAEKMRKKFLVCFPPSKLAKNIQKTFDIGKDPFCFYGLVLNKEKKPVPILHSDTAFVLFQPFYVPKDLEILLTPFLHQYPVGLWTEAGILVANPIHTNNPKLYKMFDKNQYHGAVIWSWHISLLELGLIRQFKLLHQQWLQNKDKAELKRLRSIAKLLKRLFALEEKISHFRASELWSWEQKNSGVYPVAFVSRDATESNAIQLWSCVSLSCWLEYKNILPLLQKIEKNR